MQVVLDDKKIDVIIEHKQNKNLYIRVTDNLELSVTCSKRVSEKEILDIINKNSKSLIKMYNRKLKELDNNSIFYYLGKPYTIIYNKDVGKYYIEEDCIIVKDEKMLNKFYANECVRVFTQELEKYNPYFNYLPKYSLKVRKMKTRWGVCNRGNNTVTLNSELLKKDIRLIDYVVVHELSHFKEANHSDKFWHEVSLRYPNYKEARKELNEV